MAQSETNSLQQSLTQLHAELSQARRLDERSRQMLRTALADIEALLRADGTVGTAGAVGSGATSGTGNTRASAPHRLEALAVGFEAEHPSLAASVRQFIDLLGRAGL